MRRILTALVLATLTLLPLRAAELNQALASQVMRAVALLYSQDESGSLRMQCTATAFEKTHKGYLFASAAHCVGNDDKDHAAPAADIPFYITFDERANKVFYPANVQAVGYQHRGDDFSVFEVATKEEWPIVPLGDEGKIDVGKPETATILNVASPLGLGKQLFRGSVSNVYLDRPIVEGNINWKGTMLLQISAGPGSSGSAIVSEDQKAIIGFLVGTVGGNNIIAMPVSRFKTFRDAVKNAKYKWSNDGTATE